MDIVVKVNSTYNNTIVSALYKGKILKTISTGSLGFKKSKRSSTLAAQTCGETLGSWLLLLNKSLIQSSVESRRSPKNVSDQNSLQRDYGISDRDSFEYGLLQEAKKKLIKASLAFGKPKATEVKRSGNSVTAKGNSLRKSKKSTDLTGTTLSREFKELDIAEQNSDAAVASRASASSSQHLGQLVKGDVENKIAHVSLLIAGVGHGKFGVIRGLSKLGVKIKTISDVTAVPHNGCKPPKMRRK